jgi:hypothetical protein
VRWRLRCIECLVRDRAIQPVGQVIAAGVERDAVVDLESAS